MTPMLNREIHSADGSWYIVRGVRMCWEVVVNDVHLATFFIRENARVFIRQKKFELSRFGRQEVA